MTKTKTKTAGTPRAKAQDAQAPSEEARQAARLLGAAGGRSGRGDAKRRPASHYRRIAKKSAGWRNRPETFFGTFDSDGQLDRVFYRTRGGALWRLFGLRGPEGLAALPRTAKILDCQVTPEIRAAARRLPS